MTRYLDFFDPTTISSIEIPLVDAYARGVRRVLVIGKTACCVEISELLEKLRFSWDEKLLAVFQAPDVVNIDLIVISGGTGNEVSKILHACIGLPIAVIAPVTEHHVSKRTVFLMSIPKAGTHMLIRLFGLMGLKRSYDRAPRPGTWSTPFGYEYHAPCRELLANDAFDPQGRQLLFRSPAIFVYRNPLDIIVSELDWFKKDEHAFSGYLNYFPDEKKRLNQLIHEDTVMGSIRDRIHRYIGWMMFNNVIPVSYEELVGSRGGGCDLQQAESIWALQLKLHISGSPQEYAKQLYDQSSATFSKGRIGRHLEYFGDEHFALFDRLPQDFMQTLGYSRGSFISNRIKEFLYRPLEVKSIPEELLYVPRLANEGIHGYNIVEIAGRYFPVQQGNSIESLSEAVAVFNEYAGFTTIREAEHSVYAPPETQGSHSTNSGLILEGFLGFNIVRHKGSWYGFDQTIGPTDIARLDSAYIAAMKSKKQCVIGESVTDVKMEIFSLTVLELVDELKKQKKLFDSESRRLDELLSRTDANQLESATQLESLQQQTSVVQEYLKVAEVHDAQTDLRVNEQLSLISTIQAKSASKLESLQQQFCVFKEHLKEIDARDVETDSHLDALLPRIDTIQVQFATELKSIQQQFRIIKEHTDAIFHNPFVRISQRLIIRRKPKNE